MISFKLKEKCFYRSVIPTDFLELEQFESLILKQTLQEVRKLFMILGVHLEVKDLVLIAVTILALVFSIYSFIRCSENVGSRKRDIN